MLRFVHPCCSGCDESCPRARGAHLGLRPRQGLEAITFAENKISTARKLLAGTRELATPTPGSLPVRLGKKNYKLKRKGGGGPTRANAGEIKLAGLWEVRAPWAGNAQPGLSAFFFFPSPFAFYKLN